MGKILVRLGVGALVVVALSGCGREECESGIGLPEHDAIQGDAIRIQRSPDDAVELVDFDYTFTPFLDEQTIEITRDGRLMGAIDFIDPAKIEVRVCADTQKLTALGCESEGAATVPGLQVTAAGTLTTIEEGRSYRLKAAGTAVTIDALIVHYNETPAGTCAYR